MRQEFIDKLKTIVKKHGRMPVGPEVKAMDKKLHNQIGMHGGYAYWAKKLGVPYGRVYVCRYCRKTIYSVRVKHYCDNPICQANKNLVAPKKETIRPYTYTTDLILRVDIDKGWPAERVAKVNADCLGRDYRDVLKRVNYLMGQEYGQADI